MATKVVIGAQWGDEGKGKIIDILAQESDVVVRSQGGNNAGHTVEANGVEYKLHLVPSGILGKKTLCLVGNGVVVDPKVLLEELDMLTGKGVSGLEFGCATFLMKKNLFKKRAQTQRLKIRLLRKYMVANRWMQTVLSRSI